MKHNAAKNARPSECEKGYRRWISPSNEAKPPPPKPEPMTVEEWFDFHGFKYSGKFQIAEAAWDAAIRHAKSEK